jgi:hypothetical protein
LFVFVAALLSVAGARAQVSVQCLIEPEVALQFEPVLAAVLLKNNTGTDLALFGEDANCGLSFRITRENDTQVSARENAPGHEAVYVAPGESIIVTNELTTRYDLRATGSYAVEARAVWNGKAYATEQKRYLDVLPGMEIEKTQVAVAGGAASRVYSLRMVSRSRMEHLLLRIDDEAAGICYGVYALGPFVRRREPAMQVDAQGYVHILYQDAPTHFVHRMFAPDGTAGEPVTYSDESGQVHFEVETGGGILVIGAEPENQEEE